MPLTPGTRLGPYEILAAIGAGGMGEVYRARDTRLDRTVAIKIMVPGALAGDDRVILEREARAIAGLNHPHICVLHDLGGDAHRPFLVMEYVAGETLAAALRRGPLAPRDVMRYGIQIAEALDHAHRHGVIHRDLKPANIMLTKAGVKVLDFGLAMMRSSPPLPGRASTEDGEPTARLPLASERALFGTIHYMSPERLGGQPANAPSDLFSFGAVMYEMATGRRPFESTSPDGAIDALLHAEPPAPSALQPNVPPSLDWVIQKCLAKNPDMRWRDAADVAEVLRWIAAGADGAPAATSSRRRTALYAAGAMVALGGLAAVLAYARWFQPQVPQSPTLAFSIFPPPGGGFTPTASSVPTPQFALSPNGRHLVFVAALGHSPPQLWLRQLDSSSAQPLAGTERAASPFWSATSDSIAFFADGSLKRIDLAGGPARVLAAAPQGRGGAWSREGTIVFAPMAQGGLLRISANGGQPTPVTRPDAQRHELSHRWPQFLPDERHFLYFVQSASRETQGIYEADLDGVAPPQKLVTCALSGAFVAPRHLLFMVEDQLMAKDFDWKQLRVSGEAIRVAAPVAGASSFNAAFSASQTGLLAFASTPASAELVWMDREGRRTGSVEVPGGHVDFRLSPDGQRLAIAEVDAQTRRPDILVIDLQRGSKTRVTSDAATDASPIWSPDGQRIIFRSNRSGVHDLYDRPSNGTGADRLVFKSPNSKYPTDWMPDGRGIVYHGFGGDTNNDIWYTNADGSGSKPLVQGLYDEMQGRVSSDGRWLAYTSLEMGSAEIFLRNLIDGNARWSVSAGGGTDPQWRADGRELFYLSADSWLMAVTIAGGRPSSPHKLFHVDVAPAVAPYLSNYDVSRDGRRFLMKIPVNDVTSTPIQVMTNWLISAKR